MFAHLTVIRYGSGNSCVVLPRELLGKKVYVMSDEDALDLQELVERTLLLRKIDKIERLKDSGDFDKFQRDVMYRLTRLENVIYGTKQEVKDSDAQINTQNAQKEVPDA